MSRLCLSSFVSCAFICLMYLFSLDTVLKHRKPCSNNRILMLFEHGFYMKILKSQRFVRITSHSKTQPGMSILSSAEITSLIQCRKYDYFNDFPVWFSTGIGWNASITIAHICFVALTFAGSLGRHSIVFKQLPLNPANVHAWKNMYDPYIFA